MSKPVESCYPCLKEFQDVPIAPTYKPVVNVSQTSNVITISNIPASITVSTNRRFLLTRWNVHVEKMSRIVAWIGIIISLALIFSSGPFDFLAKRTIWINFVVEPVSHIVVCILLLFGHRFRKCFLIWPYLIYNTLLLIGCSIDTYTFFALAMQLSNASVRQQLEFGGVDKYISMGVLQFSLLILLIFGIAIVTRALKCLKWEQTQQRNGITPVHYNGTKSVFINAPISK